MYKLYLDILHNVRDSRYRDSRYTLFAKRIILLGQFGKRINICYAFTVFSNDFKADNNYINESNV